MDPVTKPLRDEHRELLPELDKLRAAADIAGSVAPSDLHRAVDLAYEFLAQHLIPHAEAEDAALYPVVGRLLGAQRATATMSRDHVEVGKLTRELAAIRLRIEERPSEADIRELRRILYGLDALVRVHFAKEEEIYLPLLDLQLSPEDASQMFVLMEEAAGEAKARAAQLQ